MIAIQTLGLIGRLYLGAIWCLAGTGKVMAQPTDSALMRMMPAAPMHRNPALMVVAGGEVLVGSLLIGGWLYPWVPGISALALTAFVAARLSGAIQGNCGCMGGLQREVPLTVRQIATWAIISAGLAVDKRWAMVWQVPAAPMIGLTALVIAVNCGVVLRRSRRQPERKAKVMRQLAGSLRTRQTAFPPAREDEVHRVS